MKLLKLAVAWLIHLMFVPMLLLPSYHTSQSHESQLTPLLSELLDKGPLFPSQISLTNNKHQRRYWSDNIRFHSSCDRSPAWGPDGLYDGGRQLSDLSPVGGLTLSGCSHYPQWRMMLRVSQWQNVTGSRWRRGQVRATYTTYLCPVSTPLLMTIHYAIHAIKHVVWQIMLE